MGVVRDARGPNECRNGVREQLLRAHERVRELRLGRGVERSRGVRTGDRPKVAARSNDDPLIRLRLTEEWILTSVGEGCHASVVDRLLISCQPVPMGATAHHVGARLVQRGRVRLDRHTEPLAKVDDLVVGHAQFGRELVHSYVLRHGGINVTAARRPRVSASVHR